MSANDLPAWHEWASCKTADPRIFFPEDLPVWSQRDVTREAKAICADCIVSTECLSDALATKEPHGIRGGWTAVERKRGEQAQRRPQKVTTRRMPMGRLPIKPPEHAQAIALMDEGLCAS